MSVFNGPVFIVGMPRSGTKLLRSLLNNHPLIAFPKAETEMLIHWANDWTNYGNLSDFLVFQDFYRSVTKTSFFYYMKKNKGEIIPVRQWFEACDGWSVANVFEALIRIDADVEDNMIWGDKSPSYIQHIPLLLELYPQAKVIHIVRDVRDYALSMKKAWGKSLIRAAQRWSDDVSQARSQISEYPGRTLEVRFEDLLDNPVFFLKTVCLFLGVEFHEEMLVLNPTTELIGDAKGANTVVPGNKEKWRNKLSVATTARVETICGPVLGHYNYPVHYSGPQLRIHPFHLFVLKILDGIRLLLSNTENRSLFQNIGFFWRNWSK